MFNDRTWIMIHPLLLASRWTLLLTLISFIGAVILAYLLLNVRISKLPILSHIAYLYIGIFRNIPFILLLFLVYWNISFINSKENLWVIASIALILSNGSKIAELWLNSIILGHKIESKKHTALHIKDILSPDTFRHLISPLIGSIIMIIHDSAITSVIGFVELTKAGWIWYSTNFKPTSLIWVACIYFVMCYPLSLLSSYFRNKHHADRQEVLVEATQIPYKSKEQKANP
ncbi:ABC transporter permease subunit [Celerinatantimonas diazotrophica]|uniref:Polar amino acid transport system permease protein n=1 Tax=Celerinatantimonas diazotrophica TaxID=412034 RepID=A0A4R1J857_9GAMM|nr:ABC transporter permease subunit [Celerinatantimonas diazotrophica]TCK46755.1 polar amino acid transport system permease protein [Celerinatantimonas diazotrophica]CAG9295458.1 hypothetical protein CEDIAZO_00574 [Celerinatantimonas diazotrophica]